MRRLALAMLFLVGLSTVAGGQSVPAGESASKAGGDAPKVDRVDGDLSPPKLIRAVEPVYTKRARKAKINGTCLVGLVVDHTGMPHDVQLLRSIGDKLSGKEHVAALELDEAALQAAKQYRFSPAEMNGRPVAVHINVEVKFQID